MGVTGSSGGTGRCGGGTSGCSAGPGRSGSGVVSESGRAVTANPPVGTAAKSRRVALPAPAPDKPTLLTAVSGSGHANMREQ